MKKKIKELLFGKSIPLIENKINGWSVYPTEKIDFYEWCQMLKVCCRYPKN
jgi:hypothetical protein